MNQTEHLDLSLLQGYIDNLGKSVVQQMLDLYIGQSAIYIEEISDTVVSEKQKLWQESCHKMKGAAGSVGLLLVHKKLAAIEKSEEVEATKKMYLEELNELNTNAYNEFREWLSKAS
ncbi:phosphorelay protein [Colwellia sp. RE-S-Sl-9]